MGKLVKPEVFLVGYSSIDMEGLKSYLKSSGNEDFLLSIESAKEKGLSDGEILCSMMAKLCYASLTLGKNNNVTRVRDIPDNIVNCFNQGHLSVFEHCQLNFIVRNCSRVFTHELVRHRAGTAFSQTSGRYVRTDELDIVFDPILEPIKNKVEEIQKYLEDKYSELESLMGLNSDNLSFEYKKQVTSALRRILPNGQSNEIGFSVNLRSLRHIIQLRTTRHAEWEIREVFAQVYKIVKEKYPLIFFDAKEEEVKGILEITGMKMQPYQ